MSQPEPSLREVDAEPWIQSDSFSDIDREFARWIKRQAPDASPWIPVLAAMVSRARGEGHTCLDLAHAVEHSINEPPAGSPPFPAVATLRRLLRAAPVVTDAGGFAPLVLDAHSRLYLHRYWKYETDLAQALLVRAAQRPTGPLRCGESLDRLFPSDANPAQRLAAITAMERPLCIITGGPGTGKTHTAGLILSLLLETSSGNPPRIVLCAPTGKAAARLLESINAFKPRLAAGSGVGSRLPSESFTLHRLLGLNPVTNQPRYDARNPLPCDILVLDEASMVDVALMAKLFDALPPTARIILLGDKDQLASVEAGAVLGDICHGAGAHPASTRPESPLAQCIVQLDKSHRFNDASGIMEFSRAINQGNDDAVGQLLQSFDFGRPGVRARDLPAPATLREALREEVRAAFLSLAQETDPRHALERLGQFRILCAVRRGPYGVDSVNRCIEQMLRDDVVPAPGTPPGVGRPVLITRNDPALRLFNGDLGILLPDPQSGALRAWFTESDGTVRSILPARLPEHETAYAMTVHKSQGSEFDRILMILPDRDSPVLTRELLYTGITRARSEVTVWTRMDIMRGAVRRSIQRSSGLRDALWPPSKKAGA